MSSGAIAFTSTPLEDDARAINSKASARGPQRELIISGP